MRLNANLSQVELAKAAETTQRNISYWESGRVELNLYAALRLAQIFQVNVEYLAGYSDDFDIKPELSFNAPMGESLTEKERASLEAFRQLLPETQDFILRSTQGMNDGSPVKRFKNV